MEKSISPKKIDFTLLDSTAIEIKEDYSGYFFMIGNYRASVPPHFGARSFTGQEVLTFFIDKMVGTVGFGIVSCYLYDLIKAQRAKNIKIDGKPVDTEEEIKKALENE